MEGESRDILDGTLHVRFASRISIYSDSDELLHFDDVGVFDD